MRVAVCAAVLALAVPASAAGEPVAKARAHFFGAQNVDPATGAVRDDRVILSWFGISSLAVAIKGHVILLDAGVENLLVEERGRLRFEEDAGPLFVDDLVILSG